MEVHTPSYFTQFHCLAGACPHTCCAWWEVPVDEPTLHRLKALSGPLGERARAALTTDEEGDPCLALTGGYCPLLEENGLCALQLQEGEEALPAVCRQHPRFSYDYGSIREEGLCASCPEAARLILEGDFTLTLTRTPEAGEGEEDPLLAPMLKARQTALGLLREEAPLGQRLCALLAFGNHLQNALDEGEEGAIGDICALYDGALPLLEGVALPSRRETLAKALETLAGLEQLQPAWGELLSAGRARLAGGGDLPAPAGEEMRRGAEYFLYRHWLRCLNDGDVLTWCELAVLATAVCAGLSGLEGQDFGEVFRRFCLEVEHSQPNLDQLQDALWHHFTLPELLALAGE